MDQVGIIVTKTVRKAYGYVGDYRIITHGCSFMPL